MELIKDIDSSFETELEAYKNECFLVDKSQTPFTLNIGYRTFMDFQEMLKGFSRGIGIYPGFVAHTTYWLIENKRLLGVSNLRHQLNDKLRNIGGHIGYSIRPSERKKGYATKLLAATLYEGSKMGIKEFVLTCDKDNVASIKTIRNNNGELISEDIIENIPIQRYLINYQ
jgi:predicted acetyltransferase